MAAKKVLLGEFSGIDNSRKGRISYVYNYYSIKQIILFTLIFLNILENVYFA